MKFEDLKAAGNEAAVKASGGYRFTNIFFKESVCKLAFQAEISNLQKRVLMFRVLLPYFFLESFR